MMMMMMVMVMIDDDGDDGGDDDELGQDLLSPSVTILPYLQQSPQMTVTVKNLLDADHWHSLTLFECEHLKVVWIRRGSTFVLGLIDCYKVVSFVNPPSPLEQL